ncbi:MAG: NAD(P)-dependent oxidoreductase [Candidatus Binatia bacterium]
MIVVTGGCGFIGSEVVRQLRAKGHAVRVVDNMSKPSSRVPDGVEIVRGDLTQPGVARDAFQGARACINLAARIGGIGYFHKLPAEILSENNLIYSHTFEAAVAAKLERMLFISSSMVFESATSFPSREEDLRVIPPPFTAYGFSKLIGEWYCRAFFDQYGLRYSILRPFNAIGPEEEAGDEVGDAHVIPDLVKKIRGGQYPVELLGDGQQTRCFTHVTDIARGIVLALDHPAAVNEDFNLGNPEEITMLELARRIYAEWGDARPFATTFVPGFPSDVKRRVPDGSKAQRLLGWAPQIDFATALREVIGKA